MITFKQKEFTDREIAEKNHGGLDQALIHILKIRFGFDYDRDANTHRTSVWSFLFPILNQSLKKKKSNGFKYVLTYYIDNLLDIDRFIKKNNNFFKTEYKLERDLTEEDLEDAVEILMSLSECKNTGELYKLIYKISKKQ